MASLKMTGCQLRLELDLRLLPELGDFSFSVLSGDIHFANCVLSLPLDLELHTRDLALKAQSRLLAHDGLALHELLLRVLELRSAGINLSLQLFVAGLELGELLVGQLLDLRVRRQTFG